MLPRLTLIGDYLSAGFYLIRVVCWATPEQIGDQPGDGGEDVFAIVHREEHLAALQMVCELRHNGPVRTQRDAERGDGRHRPEGRVADRGKDDPTRASR